MSGGRSEGYDMTMRCYYRNRYIISQSYTSSMTLESVSNRQEGVYQCIADNGVGTPAVANASLAVYAQGQGKNRRCFLCDGW